MKQPIQTLREKKYRLVSTLDRIKDPRLVKERQLVINKYVLAINLLETMFPPEMDLRMRDYVYTPDSINGVKHNIIEKWDRNEWYQTDDGNYPEFYILFDPNPLDERSKPSLEFKKKSDELKRKLIINMKIETTNHDEVTRLTKALDIITKHDIVKGCR